MKKAIIIILSVFAAVSGADAQALRSAYFMEGYNLRHQLNPAFASERSYFSVALPGMDVSTSSNLGVNSFLFPSDGQLTTFMSSKVSADKFLGNLKDVNRLNANIGTSLLSVGVRTDNAFWSFDMSMKADVGVKVPYSLFDFMKNAGAAKMYDISNISARVNSYVEFALGYSRQVADFLNVGARVKVLAGIVNADMTVEKMKVQMTEDKWSIESKGKLNVSAGFMDFKTKGETGAELDSPSDRNLLDFSEGVEMSEDATAGSYINGFGAAIDLGAEIEVIPGLSVSLAINDLGFMSWKNTMKAETRGKGWSFDGFTDISFDADKDNSLSKQFEDLGEDLADMLDFERIEESGKKGGMLAATLNVGAEYVMPFYCGLTAGILSSTRFNGPYTYAEGRLYANLKPTDWFSFGVNYGVSNLGSSLGGVIGFHTSGFSMFVGADSFCMDWAKAGNGMLYPYKKLNIGLNFGLTFNIGKRHVRSLSPLVNI